jgi:hypothetical protein
VSIEKGYAKIQIGAGRYTFTSTGVKASMGYEYELESAEQMVGFDHER